MRTGVEKDLAVLRTELEKSWSEAEQQKAAALQSAKELAEEQKTRRAAQARISKVEEDLKSVYTERDALKVNLEKNASELKKSSADYLEAVTQARAAKEELRQATNIAAGKPYLLQCVFGSQAFPELTQNWRISGAFSDLPRNVEEACRYFSGCDDESAQKSFWMQFQDLPRPALVGDQLK